jgi:hypothetical protein
MSNLRPRDKPQRGFGDNEAGILLQRFPQSFRQWASPSV